MLIEVKTPELSESVQSGSLLAWRKGVGDRVRRDEVLADLETDKVVLEVAAPAEGVLSEIRFPVGSEVKAGDVLAVIDSEGAAAVTPAPAPQAAPAVAPTPAPAPAVAPMPVAAPPAPASVPVPTQAPTAAEPFLPPRLRGKVVPVEAQPSAPVAPVTPAPASAPAPAVCPPCEEAVPARTERRVPMTRLRQRIAERLKEAQNNAALLTTFNEVNMQPVMDLRKRYQERFQQEHGVKLGLMSFFTKAVCMALKAYPVINARIDGRDVIYHDYYDIGMAVSSERGLVVPVLRNADRLSFGQIEHRIANFAKRANSLELTLEELEGGTFTITNGGTFGSLLSTPIVNPPQSGVLGLHKIQDRPIAEDGQVVIRPMMYVALTYDHRIIDGREAVSFLRTVKEALEDPGRLLLAL